MATNTYAKFWVTLAVLFLLSLSLAALMAWQSDFVVKWRIFIGFFPVYTASAAIIAVWKKDKDGKEENGSCVLQNEVKAVSIKAAKKAVEMTAKLIGGIILVLGVRYVKNLVNGF